MADGGELSEQSVTAVLVYQHYEGSHSRLHIQQDGLEVLLTDWVKVHRGPGKGRGDHISVGLHVEWNLRTLAEMVLNTR